MAKTLTTTHWDVFKKKSPASELRLPLVSGAPETDSNIRLDLINQDKMQVS